MIIQPLLHRVKRTLTGTWEVYSTVQSQLSTIDSASGRAALMFGTNKSWGCHEVRGEMVGDTNRDHLQTGVGRRRGCAGGIVSSPVRCPFTKLLRRRLSNTTSHRSAASASAVGSQVLLRRRQPRVRPLLPPTGAARAFPTVLDFSLGPAGWQCGSAGSSQSPFE